jgi:hypothetical protein
MEPSNRPLDLLNFFVPIEVLLVMDGRVGSSHYASFGPGDQSTNPSSGGAYFGLSEFVRTLTAGTLPRFAVTKAHRDTDVNGAADIEHFKFDRSDLSAYDEIWLFGVAPDGGTNNPMTDSELVALAKFMNDGGGVFATGDHEDLGVALNGRVPRVRSMRKWYYPHAGPLGEPVAPPAIGATRIETTQRGSGESYTHFDDQSDDIPQPLTLRWYSTKTGPLTAARYPHPVMCGLKGPIVVAPDHMHEGEVITPWNPNVTLKFGGDEFVEYPHDEQGRQWLPEIVAWGQVLPETNTSTEDAHIGDEGHTAIARSFGVVGAYDGHRVGVGRVVVDSTWHHFFDINLVGDPVAPFPKTLGFNASPSGQAALADIENYYRNIAYWIARPRAMNVLFPAVAWSALTSQPLNMILNPTRSYHYYDTVRIGALGLENLHRHLPPCCVLVLLWQYLLFVPVRVLPPDPWTGPVNPGDPVSVDPVALVQTALGSAVVELAKERPEIERLPGEEAVQAVLHAVARGVTHGLRDMGTELGRYGAGLVELAHSWEGER